jgi:hypothetical protein
MPVMNKASLLILPLAFAVAGSATAAERPYVPGVANTTTSSVSVVTPAYYYDYKTHSSASVPASSSFIVPARTASSTSSSKSTSPTGTKTVSSTGTTTTGTTTTIPTFGAATTIYAAIRTDGIAGSGTKQNPYDASTQAKFDAIIANLFKANGAVRTTLSLGAGTYTATPVRVAPTTANPAGFVSNIPSNLEIIGAGEDKTIIKAGVVPTGSSTSWVFAYIGVDAGDYFENLTIDCNVQNQTAPHVTIDGIEFLHAAGYSTHTLTLASNVHVIDGGNRPNDPGYSEWFGINFSDPQVGSVAEITQCRVDQYQGNAGCTALVASSRITNNTVILNNNDPDNLTGKGSGGGFQDAFSPAATVSGNTCKNCTWGLYSDVDDQDGENIENNVFDTLYGGVWIYTWSAGTTIQNVYVHNNTITKSYEAAVILGNSSMQVVNSDLYIYNNKITTNVSSTVHSDILVSIFAAQNAEVFGNTFSESPSSTTMLPTLIGTSISNLSTFAWYNNKFSNGTVIPGPGGTLDHALSTASLPTN